MENKWMRSEEEVKEVKESGLKAFFKKLFGKKSK